MNGFKRFLILVLCLQMAMPSSFAMAASDEHVPEIDAQFHTKLNDFIASYRRVHKITDLNIEELRRQIAKDKFEKTYQSWNLREKARVEGNPDPVAMVREQRRLNRINAPLIQKANRIADLIYNDSFFDRTPMLDNIPILNRYTKKKANVDQFYAYINELYAIWILNPQSRQAIDLLIQVIGERHFSQQDLIELQKNRSFVSQFSRPFTWNVWVTMAAVPALLFARRWPYTNRLMEFVASRGHIFQRARQAVATAPGQQSARSAGRFARDASAPQMPWYQRMWPFGNRGSAPRPATPSSGGAPSAGAAPRAATPAPIVFTKSVSTVLSERTTEMTALFAQRIPNLNANQAKDLAQATINNVKELRIADARILDGLLVKIKYLTVNKGSVLSDDATKAAYNEILKQEEARILSQQVAVAPAPVAATPAPRAAAPVPAAPATAALPATSQARAATLKRLAGRTVWSLPEMFIIGTTKLMGRRREPWKWAIDTARFFNIPYRVGAAWSVIAVGANHLPNSNYTVIPSDEMTHGVNAMGILKVACDADVLNARTLSLMNKINADMPMETVNQEFTRLVGQMHNLANDYTLAMRVAGMYTNDIPDVYDLPSIGIEQNMQTGKLIYTRTIGGQPYRVAVECPSRKGQRIRNVDYKATDRKVKLSADRLALIELLNELSAESISALKTQYVDRMMRLNYLAYNDGVKHLVERKLQREEYMQPLLAALDARLAADVQTGQIPNRSARLTAAQYEKTRTNDLGASHR